ncbi:unnamed protein product [Rhizophagus irregularis]|nr:unnamed protein product [Rhizophagus irregularis]
MSLRVLFLKLKLTLATIANTAHNSSSAILISALTVSPDNSMVTICTDLQSAYKLFMSLRVLFLKLKLTLATIANTAHNSSSAILISGIYQASAYDIICESNP